MTTSTTDAEAIARETWRAIETYLDAECNLGSCGDLSDADRANCENFITNAILSYLASRREAQEPVAWRYRWKIDGEWVSWRVSERSQASEHLLPSLEEYPLYLAPPSPAGEVERLRKALAFYANPEIYKPHPHGPAFDRRDLSDVARAALNGVRHD